MRAVPAPRRGAAGGSVTSVTGEGGHGLAGAFWPSLSASAHDPAGVFRFGIWWREHDRGSRVGEAEV